MTDSLIPFTQAPKPARIVPARVNYTKEAFLNRYNLALLAGAVGASLVTLSGLPLILALGAELVFLGTIPRLPAFPPTDRFAAPRPSAARGTPRGSRGLRGALPQPADDLRWAARHP